MTVATRTRDALSRLKTVGQDPADDQRTRLRKQAIVVTAVVITALATIWTLFYLAIGRPVSALMPLIYQVGTVAGLVWFSRSRDLRHFGIIAVTLLLVCPTLLQWSLGGFENGSAVMIWAIGAPMAAMVVLDAKAAWLTYGAFAALVVISAVMDPMLAAGATPVPEGLRVTFFALDILGVSFATFLVLISFVRALDQERDRSDQLLANVFPTAIARRLRRGERLIADRMGGVTILFADIVDFSPLAARLPPNRLVEVLGRVFATSDRLADHHGLETIKTVGDCYMAVAGAPEAADDHARRAADMALELVPAIVAATAAIDCPVRVRVGIHSGEVVAGVIGDRRFAYDLWGPAVNLASRLESNGVAGCIQVSAATRDLLGDAYELEPRGTLDLKGIGPTDAWILRARTDGSLRAPPLVG
jgi:guanylate cyclase